MIIDRHHKRSFTTASRFPSVVDGIRTRQTFPARLYLGEATHPGHHWRLPVPFVQDSKTGLTILKILKTHSSIVTTLRIQPAGNLLATGGKVFDVMLVPRLSWFADDFGNLLFFDLETEAVDPQHSRHLLPEQGGISEICWLANDLIAVGTTRGKIIVFSNRNRAVSSMHIMDLPTADQCLAETICSYL